MYCLVYLRCYYSVPFALAGFISISFTFDSVELTSFDASTVNYLCQMSQIVCQIVHRWTMKEQWGGKMVRCLVIHHILMVVANKIRHNTLLTSPEVEIQPIYICGMWWSYVRMQPTTLDTWANSDDTITWCKYFCHWCRTNIVIQFKHWLWGVCTEGVKYQ